MNTDDMTPSEMVEVRRRLFYHLCRILIRLKLANDKVTGIVFNPGGTVIEVEFVGIINGDLYRDAFLHKGPWV